MVDPTGKREMRRRLRLILGDENLHQFASLAQYRSHIAGKGVYLKLVDKAITEFAYYIKGWGSFQCGTVPIIRYGIGQIMSAITLITS